MPVTRSQSKALVSQNPSSAQEDSEISKSVEQEEATQRPFIEWLDLDYSDNSILKQTDWKLILKEVRKVDGCRQITWTIPMEDDQRLWIIIHWWRRARRDEFRQSDTMTQTMKEVIFLPDPGSPEIFRSSPNDKAIFIYRFMYTSQKFILDCFSKRRRPDMVYEVWTVYFPAEDIVAILDSDPHYRFPRMVNYRSLPYESEDPIGAVLTQIIAFVSGEVEYKGRRLTVAGCTPTATGAVEINALIGGSWDWVGDSEDEQNAQAMTFASFINPQLSSADPIMISGITVFGSMSLTAAPSKTSSTATGISATSCNLQSITGSASTDISTICSCNGGFGASLSTKSNAAKSTFLDLRSRSSSDHKHDSTNDDYQDGENDTYATSRFWLDATRIRRYKSTA
ncbi:hypothetical protein N7467_004264 [Penicillium canescens]|nr:hypothetical protein N7467_004264 [Penicillium canescens]